MIYLLWTNILFSTAVRTVAVLAKLIILGMLLLTSIMLALRAAVVAKLVILGILFLNPFILVLRVLLVTKLVISYHYIHLFEQHHYLLHHLVYLNQQEQVLIYQHLIYLLYFSKGLLLYFTFYIYQCLIYLHKILN